MGVNCFEKLAQSQPFWNALQCTSQIVQLFRLGKTCHKHPAQLCHAPWISTDSKLYQLCQTMGKPQTDGRTNQSASNMLVVQTLEAKALTN